MTRRNLTTAEAAAVAEVSIRMMRHYARTGRITPVERIGNTMTFSPEAVADLASRIERRNRVLAAAVSDAGHLDVDRALLGLASFALGLVAALSPLAVTVYVALIAVCLFASIWLVVHELRERGHLRDPHRDRVLADPVDLPVAAARPRVEVGNLDHILIPGPFSRAGIRK